MRTLLLTLALLAALCSAAAQIREFPYSERFDSVAVPALPSGWRTSANRLAQGDFATTHSAVLSDSAAAVSTNATIAQWLDTPVLDLSLWQPESLVFHERRSASHTSGVLVEASTDGGATFPILLSDTLRNPGTTAYLRRSLALPSFAGAASGVRIRWRVVGNGLGTTGTYRLDDITVRARGRYDLRLDALSLDPPLPLAGAAVRIRATVRNAGLEPAAASSVAFFLDRNHDLRPDAEELFRTVALPAPFPAGDSAVVSAEAEPAALPADTLIAEVLYPDDQNPRDNLRILPRTTGRPPGAVIVSEIMYAPESTMPEWVEIASAVDDSVDIASWGLSDKNALTVYRIAPAPRWLPPRGFAVLTRDSAQMASRLAGAGMLVALPALPQSLYNNDSDAVVLTDHRGALMDSVHYSARWGGAAGEVSLERLEASGSSLESANWGSSEDPAGSTPGRTNSVTPLDTNLRAVGILPLRDGDSTAGVLIAVRNAGKSPVAAFGASVYVDRDGDSTESLPERVAAVWEDQPLMPGDSVLLHAAWEHEDPGEHLVIGVVAAEHDLRASDNRIQAKISFSFPNGALTVNEIMYEPLAGWSEYVEYLNAGTLPVDLQGWSLGPRRESRPGASGILSRLPFVVRPGEYLVVASDSSIVKEFDGADAPGAHFVARQKALGLSSAGDTLMLFDATGRAIDSLVYSPSWHNPDLEETRGRSLERISPALPARDGRNWSTSADPAGGTPGRRNSLYAPAGAPPAAALACAPNPFSPDGDGFEDATVISYRVPFLAGTVRVRIFDALGRLVRTLSGGEPTGAAGQMLWDGRDDRREKVPMGIYVVLVEAHDAQGTAAGTAKGVVVVAARL
jgi:hypothetical protein